MKTAKCHMSMRAKGEGGQDDDDHKVEEENRYRYETGIQNDDEKKNEEHMKVQIKQQNQEHRATCLCLMTSSLVWMLNNLDTCATPL